MSAVEVHIPDETVEAARVHMEHRLDPDIVLAHAAPSLLATDYEIYAQRWAPDSDVHRALMERVAELRAGGVVISW